MTRTGIVYATAAAAVLVAFGCSAGSDNRTFYCTDEQGVVVDEARCDGGGGGGYYLWHTGSGGTYRVGERTSGGERFAHTDQAARQRYGLPATGRVSNGTTGSKNGGHRGGGAGSGK